MPITQRNKIGMLEAMLFANAEPVETDRLAEAMRADPAEVLTLLEKLQSSSADCAGTESTRCSPDGERSRSG